MLIMGEAMYVWGQGGNGKISVPFFSFCEANTPKNKILIKNSLTALCTESLNYASQGWTLKSICCGPSLLKVSFTKGTVVLKWKQCKSLP